MIAQRDRAYLSPEEYLAAEAEAAVKHEYHDGEVYAMAGASDEHVTIAANLTAMLLPVARKNGCRLYGNDMKVNIAAYNRFYYPDLIVTCDDRDRDNRYYKQHPKLIIEVLSDSTEAFDRGEKFHQYCHLDSLDEYVLVSQNRAAIDVFRRTGDRTWQFEAYGPDGRVKFASLEFEGAIAEIYEDVTFPEPKPDPDPACK